MATKKRTPKTVVRRVGIDTGGTFTDFVYEAARKITVFKVASTPDDPSRAIAAGLERIVKESGSELTGIEIVHGTTVGTNALLQRRGSRVALVTTAGFEDVIEIGRQARPELYNLNAVKPPSLVPTELRYGVAERVACDGEVLESLTESELKRLFQEVQRARPEAVAVCLLFSFVRPEHEKRIAGALEKLQVPLSVSHQILPEYREYERTATVCVNAYLQPLMGRYLKRLTAGSAGILPAFSENGGQDVRAPRTSLRVMQSSGGSISADAAANEPVRTILSGPAGGVWDPLESTCRHASLSIL